MAEYNFSSTHDHERTDAKVKPLVIFLIAMFVVIGGSFLSMVGLFEFLTLRAASMDRAPSTVKVADELPNGPRLQVVPGLDLHEMQDAEQDRLNSYGWVDEGGRVVHIPIERAMDVVVEQGLPVRATAVE